MEKKNIQRKRMMTYFIDAAKEIIKEEGVKGVTARKVGERAGYSYATIYNYFNDLNALLTYCVFDFLEDCYHYLISHRDDKMDSREQIITYVMAYFEYFVENPDMFQLIFLEELGKLPNELKEIEHRPSVALHLRNSLVKCADDGYIKHSCVDLLGELITSSIHGKLMFFLKRGSTEDIDKIIGDIRSELYFLLKIEGC